MHALQALSNAHVHWDSKHVLRADVTCDGRPDFVAVGYEGKAAFWVGIVPGGPKGRKKAAVIRFPASSGAQNDICGFRVHIEQVPHDCSDGMDGCRPAKKCYDFGVRAGGVCDAAWFYWDADHREMSWFRH
jgi:hypothetical protein